MYLRETHGETQEDLAYSIGFETKSTISNYESGKRKPDTRMLKKIAIHYNITVEELCYGDLSYLVNKKITNLPIDNVEIINKVSAIIYPIYEPIEDKCNDELFKKGYEAQMKIREYFYNGAKFDSKLFEICHDSYVESINENGTIESVANLLWLYIFITSTWNNRHMTEGIYELYDKQIDKSYFYKNYVLKSFKEKESSEDEAFTLGEESSFDNKELKILEKYVEKDEAVYALLFKYLRKNAEGCEYADYYMALQYINNLIENDEDITTNQKIGCELMRRFAVIGNKYARNYWKVYDRELSGENDV